MKKGQRLILWAFVLTLLHTGQAIAGNRYRTDLLQRMAEALSASEQLDSLPAGRYVGLLDYKAHPVTVVVEDSVITHIGYAFFPIELREAMPSPALDFVERYPLSLDLPLQRGRSVARHLDEDGVFFRGGNMASLHRVVADTTLGVSVENLNGKRYSVRWTKENGEEAMGVNFPIEYNLLAGTDLMESERRILADVVRCSTDAKAMTVPDTASLQPLSSELFVCMGDTFYLPQINANRYYERTDRDSLRLVCGIRHRQESVANLLTTGELDNDYDLQIRLMKYGFKQDTVQVKLNQWLNYCLESGCKAYFGLIGLTEDTEECELIMWNKDMGYIHTMRLLFDEQTLMERKGLIEGRLNSHIGITKVQSLFGEKEK